MKTKILNVFIICLVSFQAVKAQKFEWASNFGGNGEDVVRDVHVTNRGEIYTSGYFTDTAIFNVNNIEETLYSNGFYDIFVQKSDTSGNLLWVKGVGGSMFEYATGLVTDDEGNIYITGVFSDTVDFDSGTEEFILSTPGDLDIFVLKLNPQGEFVWAKQIGGVDYEETTAIGYSPKGYITMTGYMYNTVDFNPGPDEFLLDCDGGADSFILFLNKDGEFVSVKKLGGLELILALDMDVHASGDIFVTGYFSGTVDFNPHPDQQNLQTASESSLSLYILHLDAEGNYKKSMITHGGKAMSMGIAVDSDTNAYLTGYFYETVNFDPDSLAGDGNTFLSDNNYNGFVMKVNNKGELAWARHQKSDHPFFSYDVAVNSKKEVHVSGFFEVQADFNLSPEQEFMMTKKSNNATDAYLLVLDENGVFKNAYQFGGVDFIDDHNMAIDLEDNIYLAAHFETGVDINPLPDEELTVTAILYRDSYLIRLSTETTIGIKQQVESMPSIYPNPAFDMIHVSFLPGDTETTYTICNTLGKIIKTGKISPNQSIDIDEFNKGVYFLSYGNHRNLKFSKL